MDEHNLTLAQIEAFRGHLLAEERAPGTVEKYQRDLRAFLRWLDGRAVTQERAAEWKTELLATNITNTKRFDIETPDIVIKVNPERTDLIETKLIDGRQCLVIAVDDHVEVNGISVRTVPKRTITDPNMDEEEELL